MVNGFPRKLLIIKPKLTYALLCYTDIKVCQFHIPTQDSINQCLAESPSRHRL